MISNLVSSFGAGHSNAGVPAPSSVQSYEAAQTAQLASAAPHVAAALNASVARTTIQAILESSQAQRSTLSARSGFAEEGDLNMGNRRISRAAGEYDEVAEGDEDEEDETFQSKSWR